MRQDLERGQSLGTKVRRACPAPQVKHRIDPLIISPYYWHFISEGAPDQDLPLSPLLAQQLHVFQQTFKKLKKDQQSVRWIHTSSLYDITMSFSDGTPSRHIEGLLQAELAVLQHFQETTMLKQDELVQKCNNFSKKYFDQILYRLIERQLLRYDATENTYSLRL